MLNKILFSIFIFTLIFLSGCAPREFKPYEPPEIKYQKTENYSIQSDLEKIVKPDKLVPAYAKIEGDKITILPSSEGANYIVLAPEEYAKVAAVVKLTGTYKKIIIDQEELVNHYISMINALKEQVEIERRTALMYRQLWVDSVNQLNQERYEYKWEKTKLQGMILLESVGIILILAL